MKRKVITIILSTTILLTVFGAGVYASENGWISFTGSEAIEQSKSHIDEIMDILEEVHNGKISAEDALRITEEELRKAEEEFENNVPNGLAKQIRELKNENRHLEDELIKANEEANDINNESRRALNKAKTYIER